MLIPSLSSFSAVAGSVATGDNAPVTRGEHEREYVETFDFDRRASLYLTFHTYGDRRQRGLELIRLKRRYAEAGLALAEGELPDYLPVVLEFAALAPEPGRALLAELREPVELVRARLHERESRYAALFDTLAGALPGLTRRQAERLRRLAEEGPPAELVGLEPVGQLPAGLGTVPT
ncbi:MAG TPA: nitrate reductase molybdenum cofactor assembly chaperone [Gaiellaceae bacterium]|nr:nitrate reductase molybdenum cofactor assembly chaperone [Gaiellaceae bacterium]